MADVINNGMSKAVQLFGYAPNGTLQAINVDSSGNLKCVTGSGGSQVVSIANNVATPINLYGRAPNNQLQAATTDASGNLNVKNN